jgi:hypothetical protein
MFLWGENEIQKELIKLRLLWIDRNSLLSIVLKYLPTKTRVQEQKNFNIHTHHGTCHVVILTSLNDAASMAN